VVLVGFDAAVVLQSDEIAALAGIEQGGMDVVAVGDGIRLLESRRAFFAELDAGDQLAGEGVAHLHAGRLVGVGQHGVLEADALQHAEDVGAELNAGTDLAEIGRLLEHADREAFVGQRTGGRQPGNAATGDQEGAVLCHEDVPNLRWRH
jgi:hypothetical protein